MFTYVLLFSGSPSQPHGLVRHARQAPVEQAGVHRGTVSAALLRCIVGNIPGSWLYTGIGLGKLYISRIASELVWSRGLLPAWCMVSQGALSVCPKPGTSMH